MNKLFFAAFALLIFSPTFAFSATLSRAPNNLGLVGYWAFDEGSGNIAGDSSGNGNAGTISNPIWTDGKHGKAFYGFSGSKVDVGDKNAYDFGTGDFTISLWVRGMTGETGLITKDTWAGSGSPGIFLYVSSGYRYWNGATAYTIGSASATSWRHITMVRSGTGTGQLALYYDGVAVSGTFTDAQNYASTQPLTIGNSPDGGHAFMNGSIDDVRIYNRALTATQVAALYGSGQVTRKSVSNQGLVGYWALNEGRGVVAGDSSGKGSQGTLTNFALSGAISNWTSGKRGAGLAFDGVNDQINIGTPAALNFDTKTSITLAGWANLSWINANWPVIVAKQSGGGDGQYNLQFGENTDRTPALYLNVGWWGRKVKASSALSINRWYYITATYDGVNARIYIDGVLSNSASLSGAFSGNSADTVYIGQAQCFYERHAG